MEAARRATSADLEDVAVLCRAALRELAAQARGGPVFVAREARAEPVEDSLAALLDDDAGMLVAGTIDDVVIGYATGRVEDLRDGSRLGIIDDLFVAAGAREVAVGEAMMSLLLEWFERQRCRGVDSTALPGNRATKNFFEESGFTARLIVMHHRLQDAVDATA